MCLFILIHLWIQPCITLDIDLYKIHIGGVIVYSPREVDCEFKTKSVIFCFLATYAELRSNEQFARNQNNVSERNMLSTCWLSFQCTPSTIKMKLKVSGTKRTLHSVWKVTCSHRDVDEGLVTKQRRRTGPERKGTTLSLDW